MANITYTVNQDTPQSIPTVETFSQQDNNLVSSFQINQLFDSTKNTVELHIYNLAGELQQSVYRYTNYKELGNAASAGREGASVLTIDPITDVELYGYDTGEVKLFYNFINNLFSEDKTSPQFFIDSISADRTELKLNTLERSPEQLINYVNRIKDSLQNRSYFDGFRLNFGLNLLIIGLNIDILQENGNTFVVVKLYESLPEDIEEKTTLTIVELISDSIVYEVQSNIEIDPETPTTLKAPNFDLDITDESIIPTGYYNYDTLFSLPISNTTNELYSIVNTKGVQLSIDHTDYRNFIHFSSAQERLLNFKYKLDLIQSYTAQINSINTITTSSLGTTGSLAYYESLVKGIVNNFDHYERFLYYESGSDSWPKTNSTKPYINDTTSVGDTWFDSKQTVAATYDATNTSILINSIPTYLRDDTNNASYITFIHMIGQHFDNMWIYAKGVSDKYDADNRLDFGISKDLVAEVLKNFGVKLYTSNKSIEDLFSTYIGQAYQSGSEVINTYVTGSVSGSNTTIQPSSFDNYQKEIQKRIYHNLPLLLKSKGTERGLRALINCFGIPSDILNIKIYGGRDTNERPFYGDYQHYTSSLDKIRLDNTGSLISGSTLSSYTSIIKRDNKYTDDLHPIEVGFSPTDNVNNYIISKSLSTGLTSFNIDDYIGDPRNLTSDNYGLLNSSGSLTNTLSQLTDQIMSSSNAYNVYDYVRLIKFYDNTIFKMVKDFIPARSIADTGIIIKPHLLQRNKAKSPSLSGSRPEHSGSIDTAFIESSDGDTFGAAYTYTTSYIASVQTPRGLGTYLGNNNEQPKYNGEFSGSLINISNGELNNNNPYKNQTPGGYNFGNIQYVSSSNEICLLSVNSSNPLIITSSTFQLTKDYLFNFTRQATVYSTSSTANITGSGTPGNPYSPTTLPFDLSGYGNYDQFYISASSVDINPQPCSASILIRFATCSLGVSTAGSIISSVRQGTEVSTTDITSWFNIHPLQTQVQYTASYNSTEEGIPNPQEYAFTQPEGTNVTITVVDPYSSNCQASVTVYVGECTYSTISTGSLPQGLEFEFSEYRYLDSQILIPDGGSGVDIYNQGSTVLNGTVFNPYGVPVDMGIGFSPKYLQLPRTTPTTQYGTPPNTYQIQSNKDRGIQSYFSPYSPIPGQGLIIPSNIVFNVYTIMNDPFGNLADEGKYVHTTTNPIGTDNYIAYLTYRQIDTTYLNTDTGNAILTALGAALVFPTDPDIAGPTSQYTQLRPIYFVTPPINVLGDIPGATNQTINIPTDTLTIREKYPVAYHIQGVTTGGGVPCTGSITIYPRHQVFPQLTPSSKQSGISTPDFTFVNKSVFVDISQVVWGENPIGVPPPIIIPIRKRA